MTPTVDVLKTKQNLTGNAGKNCVRQEYAAIRPGLLRQTIGGLEFLKPQPVAAFLATSAIICEARKLLRPNQSNFNPEFFVFRVSSFTKKIGLFGGLGFLAVGDGTSSRIVLLHDFPRKEVSYRGHAEHGSSRASEIRVLFFRLDSGRALFLKPGSHAKSYHT
jgi:hypothetical protein